MVDRIGDLRALAGSRRRGSSSRAPSWSSRSSRRSPAPSPPMTPQLSSGVSRNPLLSVGPSSPKAWNKETPLEAFVKKLDGIKYGPLRDLEFILRDARDLQVQALTATSAKAEQDSVAKAEFYAQRASECAASTCQALQSMAVESRAGLPGSSEAALRSQSYAGATVLFQKRFRQYFQEQLEFKEKMEEKMQRQIRAMIPDADKMTVDAVAAGQASAASAIQATVGLQAGTGPLSPSTALQARALLDPLAKLDEAAKQLVQILRDIETMVNSQQEVINDISSNISMTLQRTQEATRHLALANASRQAACRFRMCILTVLSVIAAIVFVVMLSH
eukprot:TRINITY_DN72151_c0_g1_i1.p1 TRINITY_DN72151_c0_g1~~TRINITY_DN72151_c0_g1_i1.p1  ORF type:complete len:333 (-),score=66.72 TRINITY_DN72151_c0_g1_i1:22-1020(-)